MKRNNVNTAVQGEVVATYNDFMRVYEAGIAVAGLSIRQKRALNRCGLKCLQRSPRTRTVTVAFTEFSGADSFCATWRAKVAEVATILIGMGIR